jgi:hypothetical protein
MPLGNLTSQFFANVYLNELDQFVKHKLKVKYYIRYVDDFVILHPDKSIIEKYQKEITSFLNRNLKINLHSDKSKIQSLSKGVVFLGFRIFPHYKLLKKSNLRSMKNKLAIYKSGFQEGKIDYDKIYDFVEGWFAYAKNADTHNLRKKISVELENVFLNEISSKEINRISKSQESIYKNIVFPIKLYIFHFIFLQKLMNAVCPIASELGLATLPSIFQFLSITSMVFR